MAQIMGVGTPGSSKAGLLSELTPIIRSAGLRKSVLKRAVIVAIVCIRYVALLVIGIAVVQFALPPAMNIGTMAQLFDVGQECSVIFLWTYLVAAIALTTWSTVFMSILS